MRQRLIIGSRGSDLALLQANLVRNRLEANFPEADFEIKTVTTIGDQLMDVALSKIGDKGLFTSQIENQLLDGTIDFAVHSLKDLQTLQPEGLAIGAVCGRELPDDAFISSEYDSIEALPPGAKVATGSLRRKSQLLHYRPDLEIVDIRGNVPTRLKKFDESNLDGLILAYAGLHRLGLDARVRQLIPFEIMLPAVGQGVIAVEVRQDDKSTSHLAATLDDVPTRTCITAERSFLRYLEGGCQVPIGANARFEGGRVTLVGMVGSLDGSVVLRERIDGDAISAEKLGVGLAKIMIEKGAAELLSRTRAEAANSTETVM